VEEPAPLEEDAPTDLQGMLNSLLASSLDLYVEIEDEQQPIPPPPLNNNVRINLRRTISRTSLPPLQDIVCSCLFDAIRTGDVVYIRHALSQFPALLYSKIGTEGDTVLMHSIYNKQKETFMMLLNEYGVDKNNGNNRNMCPLHISVMTRDTTYLTELLNHGSFCDIKTFQGKTALIQACEQNNTEAVRILLQRGAFPLLYDNQGRTALWYCCELNHIDCLKLLLEHATKDVQMKVYDETGVSPLHGAVQHGHVEIVRFLKEMGAPLTCKTKFGESVTDVASDEIRQILLESEPIVLEPM
jgi:ankyrin repeat protein